MRNRLTVLLAAVSLHLPCYSGSMRVDVGFNVTIDGPVYALNLQQDGRIIVGGRFTTIGGVTRTNLARLNVDGTIDESFSPNNLISSSFVDQIVVTPKNIVAGVPGLGAPRYDMAGNLELTYPAAAAFAIDSQGRQIFGAITEYQRWDRVGRFNESRLRDTNFNPQIDQCCLNRGVNAVTMQNISGHEQILIGGNFGNVNGEVNWGLARLNGDGSTDTTFKGDAPGPVVAIDLQPDGNFYAAIRLSVARYFSNGTRDASFEIKEFSYNDYYRGVKADTADGVVAWGSYCPVTCRPLIRKFNGDGSLDTNFFVNIDGPGPIEAVAIQNDGGILIGGRFTTVNCIPRSYIARLIPSDTPDELPCVPPPPKADPQLTVTKLHGPKMACCWTTNYPEYTLQATKRLRPKHPEKEKWVTVTNLPVQGESTVCVTNRILRWGRHYRLSK
jgi:uncharacterized delta-60 repeat protein